MTEGHRSLEVVGGDATAWLVEEPYLVQQARKVLGMMPSNKIVGVLADR